MERSCEPQFRTRQVGLQSHAFPNKGVRCRGAWHAADPASVGQPLFAGKSLARPQVLVLVFIPRSASVHF